jgi:hypothetical protein
MRATLGTFDEGRCLGDDVVVHARRLISEPLPEVDDLWPLASLCASRGRAA